MTKKIVLAAIAALLLLPCLAPANGFSRNGLGSRAEAMGGAFVSIADDFSAVFWNPAGAARFHQSIFGFSGSDLMPCVTYQNEPVDAKTRISHYLGFLAGYYKPLGDRIVLGLGIGTPSGQGVTWNGSDLAFFTDGVVYDWSTRIYRLSFSPMAAIRISEAISFGAALNIDHGNWSFKMPGGPNSDNPFIDLGQYDGGMNGWGIGATFGLLVRPSDRFAVGLTVRTPLTINFDGTAGLSNVIRYGFPGSSSLEGRITWPLWIGGGVSFRPIARLLLSADLQWTQWSKLDRIETSFAEPAWDPFLANIRHFPLGWRDALQFRVGGEFLLNPTTALRAGYYGDPAPGQDPRPDILLPTFTGNAFTVGLGKTFGGLQLDFGLEYLAGHDRRVGMPALVSTMHAVIPTVSASYRF